MKLIKSAGLFLTVLIVGACSMTTSDSANRIKDRLPECGNSPNCVSSEDARPRFHIAPVKLMAGITLDDVAAALVIQPKTTVVAQNENQLHAESRSKLFGFVDDIQLVLTGDMLQFYSKSRVGYSDLGVNRKRIEALISQLESNGWVLPIDENSVTNYP